MEIDEDDAPYLNLRVSSLRHDQESKLWSYQSLRSGPSQKTGMDIDFARVWHAVGWDGFVPVEENGSRLLTI